MAVKHCKMSECDFYITFEFNVIITFPLCIDIRERLLPHSVQLGNFSYAGNLASLQVGPQSGYKMYQEPTDT